VQNDVENWQMDLAQQVEPVHSSIDVQQHRDQCRLDDDAEFAERILADLAKCTEYVPCRNSRPNIDDAARPRRSRRRSRR
jgi:hypothetical protein